MEMDWLPEFELTREEKHVYFLREAYKYASINVNDLSTKLGAVIVGSRNMPLSYGANGLPDFLEDIPERHERPLKYDYVRHAERNSITNAAKRGVSVKNATMYCPWYACPPCAIEISDSGIAKVVGHYEMFMRTPDKWKEPVARGFGILHEKGVNTLLYTGRIGGVTALMNGQVWNP